jgi:hypothetical protein
MVVGLLDGYRMGFGGNISSMNTPDVHMEQKVSNSVRQEVRNNRLVRLHTIPYGRRLCLFIYSC